MSTQPSLSRRSLIALGGATAGGIALSPLPVAAQPTTTALPSGLFQLGVASGDPWPDGVTLWTRLAPDPVAEDGHSGMPPQRVQVDWQVATDPGFSRIVKSDRVTAEPDWAHAVHVDVGGLQPDREYWYRFRAGGEISPVGRAITAPAPTAALAELTFAFASCQNYPAGYFTALADLADQDVDLILHLGDYIYEGGASGRIGRAHLPEHETFSLADYRIRYSQYKSDPDLQLAHAHAPWVVIPDDHEVENNWAGDHSQPDNEPDQDPAVFRQRRAAAYQAYWENMPLRKASKPKRAEMQIYRRLRYGNLLHLDVLDTRRFRDQQIFGSDNPPERWDPDRTMLGAEQEQWLLDGLGASTATWNVLGNQVYLTDADHTEGEGERYSTDTWANYAGARQRLFDGLQQRGAENFVVVTGDAHRSVAGDLLADFRDDSSPVIGAEFLGTSISSAGDGSDQDELGRVWLEENPYMKFHNRQRGYQLCKLTHEELITEYRVVDRVTVPDGTVSTRSRIYVEAGNPGIIQVED